MRSMSIGTEPIAVTSLYPAAAPAEAVPEASFAQSLQDTVDLGSGNLHAVQSEPSVQNTDTQQTIPQESVQPQENAAAQQEVVQPQSQAQPEQQAQETVHNAAEKETVQFTEPWQNIAVEAVETAAAVQPALQTDSGQQDTDLMKELAELLGKTEEQLTAPQRMQEKLKDLIKQAFEELSDPEKQEEEFTEKVLEFLLKFIDKTYGGETEKTSVFADADDKDDTDVQDVLLQAVVQMLDNIRSDDADAGVPEDADEEVEGVAHIPNTNMAKEYVGSTVNQLLGEEGKQAVQLEAAAPVQSETAAEAAPVRYETVAEAVTVQREAVAEVIPVQHEAVAEAVPVQHEAVAEAVPVRHEAVAEAAPVQYETTVQAEAVPVQHEAVVQAEAAPIQHETAVQAEAVTVQPETAVKTETVNVQPKPIVQEEAVTVQLTAEAATALPNSKPAAQPEKSETTAQLQPEAVITNEPKAEAPVQRTQTPAEKITVDNTVTAEIKVDDSSEEKPAAQSAQPAQPAQPTQPAEAAENNALHQAAAQTAESIFTAITRQQKPVTEQERDPKVKTVHEMRTVVTFDPANELAELKRLVKSGKTAEEDPFRFGSYGKEITPIRPVPEPEDAGIAVPIEAAAIARSVPQITLSHVFADSENGAQQVVTQIVTEIFNQLPEKGGTTTFVMTLNPESLGKVTVKLVEEAGKISVSVTAHNRRTAEILSERFDNLQTAMKENGTQLEKYQVVYAPEKDERSGEQNFDGSSKNPYVKQDDEESEGGGEFAELLQNAV